MSFDFQKNSLLTPSIANRESSQNALRRIQDKEQEYSRPGGRWMDCQRQPRRGEPSGSERVQPQTRSVYEHTRGGEHRSDAVLCRSSSIFTDSPCIGLDFDNTIVCYDHVFHKVALEQGLIPKELPASKEIIRDYLRKANAEHDWTLLQGTVYGTRMEEASPFPGLFDFLKIAKDAGFKICIISHKTKTPYLGPPHDLHEAALNWMKSQLFFEARGADIARENVFLETSKEKKLERIKTAGCHLFIDDLPEILSDPHFPQDVQRLLFSSNVPEITSADLLVAADWKRVSALVANYFSHGN